jgi:hypothetical protein
VEWLLFLIGVTSGLALCGGMAHARNSTSNVQPEVSKLNGADLYSTQIQGSGKVPPRHDTIIRMSYDDVATQSAPFTLPGDTMESHRSDCAGAPTTRRLCRTLAEQADKSGVQRVIEALLPSGRSQLQSARRSDSLAADYFWNFGNQAFLQASQMNEDGQMWLLLPKNQSITADIINTASLGTRGVIEQAHLPECAVPGAELCVE